jgi:hypothetical protein
MVFQASGYQSESRFPEDPGGDPDQIAPVRSSSSRSWASHVDELTVQIGVLEFLCDWRMARGFWSHLFRRTELTGVTLDWAQCWEISAPPRPLRLAGGFAPPDPPTRSLAGTPAIPAPLAWLTRCARSRGAAANSMRASGWQACLAEATKSRRRIIAPFGAKVRILPGAPFPLEFADLSQREKTGECSARKVISLASLRQQRALSSRAVLLNILRCDDLAPRAKHAAATLSTGQECRDRFTTRAVDGMVFSDGGDTGAPANRRSLAARVC